jgi:hypothetical protein
MLVDETIIGRWVAAAKTPGMTGAPVRRASAASAEVVAAGLRKNPTYSASAECRCLIDEHGDPAAAERSRACDARTLAIDHGSCRWRSKVLQHSGADRGCREAWLAPTRVRRASGCPSAKISQYPKCPREEQNALFPAHAPAGRRSAPRSRWPQASLRANRSEFDELKHQTAEVRKHRRVSVSRS